jgi:hypothetical protein
MCRHRLLFPESPEARVEVRELRIARPRQHRRVGNPLVTSRVAYSQIPCCFAKQVAAVDVSKCISAVPPLN